MASRAAARARLAGLRSRLEQGPLAATAARDVGSLTTALLDAAAEAGTRARDEIAYLLPKRGAASAMIATKADLADFREQGRRKDPAGEAYAFMAREAVALAPLRHRYEELLAAAWRHMGGESAQSGSAIGRLARQGQVYPPSPRSLDAAHPYALDVFFANVDYRGEAERGPEILSLTEGVVLASAADWRGGAGLASYRGGGISPNSGNGIIVYDPRQKRYYSYFHLSEVRLRPGDLVRRGESVGRGGDTGANARKPGHGGHVHVEIFDATSGKALRAREIRAAIFGG